MSRQENPVIIRTGDAHKASVIWLHGLGADGNDFAPIVPELGLPKDAGIKFIFPHAGMRPITINGGMVMRGWYDVRAMDLTVSEDQDGIAQSAGVIQALLDEEIEQVQASRVILAGFSQGGAMALHVGLRYPQALAGILALSTYLPLSQTFEQEASSHRPPILMMHGMFDPVIPVHAADRSCRFLRERGYDIDWQQYMMQHAVCPQQIEYIGQWLRQRLAL